MADTDAGLATIRARWRSGECAEERKARLRLIVTGKRDVAQALLEAAAREEQESPRRYAQEVGRS